MNRTAIQRRAHLPAATLALLSACASDPGPTASGDAPHPQPAARGEALPLTTLQAGKRAFTRALPGTNGRSCASCHVLEEATTLRPESVAARLARNPDDPLFNRIDADDPDASELSFEHLQKGLVRVLLPLPDNMDVLDLEGNVITPPDRTIFVWRGVPSVANSALTAPYQLDGRIANLQDQAQAAILGHSEGSLVPRRELDRIAAFEASLFSSRRAAFVGTLLELGIPLEQIPVPEQFMRLSSQEERGMELYEAGCAACHGGATTHRIVDREVHDFFFPALKSDGNVRFENVPGVGPVPVRLARPNQEILNTGYGIVTYFGQLGLGPAFNAAVELPRYRFRFYADGARTEAVVDLPPTPVTLSGDPFDPRPARDADGAPIVGPNLIPQLFTTDPGLAAVTGDLADFEAFDVPQLRGIADTAPYFHDNSAATLRDAIDIYSQFVLPVIPALGMPPIHPPEQPGGAREALSPAEKADLIAFLNRL